MIKKLRKKIEEANKAYRLGNSIMSDSEYDLLLDELSLLDPDNEILTSVGYIVPDNDSRKAKLPIQMFSMNKIKTIEEVDDWSRLKSIKKSELVIITPKYDGLSLCVEEVNEEAFTRGDGTYGQKSNEHYKLIKNHLKKGHPFTYTFGEVIMPKKTFIDKYSNEFENPRNLVGGLMNSKEVQSSLGDCVYIKYGAISDRITTKKEILDTLNNGQDIKVPYHICKLSELTEELLIGLFKSYSTDYEIDGLIIEVNDIELQSKLGRETSSSNPVFARAFKHESFSMKAETEITNITWEISKQGLLKPVAQVKPIRLDGVTVTNCTLNNARFVKDMGLGVGAIVKIVRSGMVIPKIVEIVKSVKFQMPVIEGVEIDWNENGVELITLTETDEQKIKKIIAFFEILEADNISEGVVTQLWNAGYQSIKDILNLKKEDLVKLEGFGKRKSEIVFNSVKKSVTGVTLSKLQHSTGLFVGLGSKKLALLEHFKTKPTIEEVISIEGFADISAQSYIDGYDKFKDFIKDLPVTIEEKVEVAKMGSDLDGMVFVFTGIRLKDIEPIIESRGGKIGSGVSKTTTHLVCKDPNAGSSKLEKASQLGIKIISVEELNDIIG